MGHCGALTAVPAAGETPAMRRFDEAARARLREAVREAEAQSDLEVVCRVVPRCDGYLDVALLAGVVTAIVALAVVLFAPFEVDPAWVLPVVLGAGLLVGVIVGRSPDALRLLAGARMEARVQERAEAEMHREAVTGTRRRTGVLVMAALLEDRIVTLVDLPLEGRAPRAAWAGAAQHGRGEGDLVERMAAVVAALGLVGREHVPPLAQNLNELPDEVRVG